MAVAAAAAVKALPVELSEQVVLVQLPPALQVVWVHQARVVSVVHQAALMPLEPVDRVVPWDSLAQLVEQDIPTTFSMLSDPPTITAARVVSRVARVQALQACKVTLSLDPAT